MSHEATQLAAKVLAIFREIAGERADRLAGNRHAIEAIKCIGGALSERFGEKGGTDIGFHLADWNSDAAFLVAVHLFPERFTAEEIRVGVTQFLIHAPNHVAAAAKLGGYPVQDVWGLGVLSDDGSREMPDDTNFYATIETKLAPEAIARLYPLPIWTVRKCAWHTFEALSEFAEVVIDLPELITESSYPVLIEGCVADVAVNAARIVEPLLAAGLCGSFECYDNAGTLIIDARFGEAVR